MKKTSSLFNSVCAGLLLLLTTSCGSSDLYNWSDYENASYNYTKDPTQKNETKLMDCFNEMTKKPNGLRKVVPPGLQAEQAYLLIKQGKKEEAIEKLKQEMALYPESAQFINKIISQIEK